MHNDYYVYLHARNDTGEIFYVGKGRKERASARVTLYRAKTWRKFVQQVM